MGRRLTLKGDTLNSLRPDGQRTIFWDASRPGFGVRVSRDGARAFVYRYCIDYRQRLMTLRPAGKSFADALRAYEAAKTAVIDARNKRREGIAAFDPLTVRQRDRGALVRAEREAMSVADAVKQFLAERRQNAERRAKGEGASEPGLRESTAKAYGLILGRDFSAHARIKGRTLRSLTPDDLTAALDDVNQRGAAAADRARDCIAALFTWATKRGIVVDNIARDLPTYYVPQVRDRVLSADEIAALLKLLDGDAMRSGRLPKLALVLALVTGQRSGELLRLEWRDVDAAGRTLTIPASVGKTATEHRVPLSPIALEIIGELRALAGNARWLFPGDDPASPMQQQTIGVMLRRNGKLLQRHGIAAFAPHDMRRTCRTHLSALGVPESIGELILGHALPGKVQAAYAHHSFADEMREALDKWSARLCELRGRAAQPPAVTPLPVRAAAE